MPDEKQLWSSGANAGRQALRSGSLLLLCAFVACAITEPPTGGPEDRTPPRVEGTSPSNGTVGVAPDAVVELTFNESMTRANIERHITFHPDVFIKKTRWSNNTVSLELEEPLHPDTTYLVELGAGYADTHGVRSDKVFRFAFATSSFIDSGEVSGRVYFRREPSDKAVVKLFVLPRDSGFAPQAGRPDREGYSITIFNCS